MRLPRWLTPKLGAELDDIDRALWDKRHNGPLVVEVHYRGGQPQIARVRDVLMAPVILEMSLAIIHASSS